MFAAAARFAPAIGVFLLGSLQAAAPADKSPAKPGATIVAIVERASRACLVSSISADGVLMPVAKALVLPDPGSDGFRIDTIEAREGQFVKLGKVVANLSRPGTSSGAASSAATSTSLKAPADGVIIRSRAVVGAPVSAGAEPLFEIAINGEMEFVADVPSTSVAVIRPTQAARVELESARDLSGHLESDRALSGRVRKVAAEIDPKTQLARVRIRVDQDPSLRAGIFGHARIDAKHGCGIVVPRTSVLGESVQVVRDDEAAARAEGAETGDGVVETRHVKAGLSSECKLEVLEGVSDGEWIVKDAGTSLRDGLKVRWRNQTNATGGC